MTGWRRAQAADPAPEPGQQTAKRDRAEPGQHLVHPHRRAGSAVNHQQDRTVRHTQTYSRAHTQSCQVFSVTGNVN